MRTVLAGSLSPSTPTYSQHLKCFLISVTPHHWRDVLSGSQLRSEGGCGTLRARTQSTPTSLPKILKSFSTAEEEVSQGAEEIQNIKMYPGLWKVPNRFDPQYATGICSFPLCCCSTMNHNKGWKIQARESFQWDSHSLQCKGRLLFTRVQKRWPQFGTNRRVYNTYHPLSNIH